ncbi:MAG TPA: VanW family protein [Polyangiaceae bacterium]
MNRWTGKLSFLGRGAWAIGIAAVAGAVIAYLLVPVLPSPGDPKDAAIEVRMLGQPMPLDDRGMRIAMERVRRYAATNIQLQMPDGKSKELSLARLGVQIDKLHLTALVRDARDPMSLLRRAHRKNSKSNSTPLELPVPIALEPADAMRELLRVKDEMDRVPNDARMDLERRELVAEVEGRLLDVDKTFLAIEQAVRRGERKVLASTMTLPPRRRASELGNVKFNHVLGYFETRYDRSDKSRERTYNLRLAASKLDGHVLLPGETFDFNDVVGPRDEANGYRVAPVIAEGEVVDGIGGGTCQISGTLHGAVFFSGLELVERISHTRPSSYIKMGLDATVVYPTINFRFKNSFDFPVVLHETVKNGSVRAEILGPERKHVVTFIRRITDALPYEQIERDDDRLPRGVRVLAQRGVAGFSVTRYRIVREGPNAVRERWSDRYPPTPQIVRVGTGEVSKDALEKDIVLAKDDPHPEYLADELLVMTEGDTSDMTADDENANPDDGARQPNAQTNEESPGIWESRQAGRTGVAGWTKDQKMPQWDPEMSGRRGSTSSKSSDATKSRSAGAPSVKDSRGGTSEKRLGRSNRG